MEVFDIAARISMVDGASQVIGALMREVPKLGKHFEDLEKKAHGASFRVKTAMAGIGTAMAGVGLFEGLSKFEEAGEELVHVKTLFAAALPAATRVADMAKITAAAFKESSDNMRSTLVGNVAAMHDLYTVTQSVDHATQLLPAYNRLQNAFSSVKDQDSLGERASGGNIAAAIRAFELTGRNTEDKIAKAADGFVRTTIALGEKAISGGQLLTQMSNAGDSRYGFSDDFLTKVMPAMIATGLQNRTGSALNAGSNNLYGGVASSYFQGHFQEKWGIHKESDELLDDKGHFKGYKVGSMWHADQFRSNPLLWANEYRERLQSEFHVDTSNPRAMQDIVGEIGRGNKLLKAELDELLLPQTNAQLNKEVGNVNKVGPDALPILDANDPKAVREALKAKWKDAMDSLGEQLVQPMLDNVIKPLTGVLRDVSQFAGAHPAELKAIGVDLLKFSAGLTATGAVLASGALIAALGPAGWLIAGLGALGTAISVYRPNFFSEFASGWTKIWDGITSLDLHKIGSGMLAVLKADFDLLPTSVKPFISTALHNIGDHFVTAIKSIPDQLSSAIADLGHIIANKIGDAFRSVGGFLGGLFHTSFEGGGVGGGGFINASYGGGGTWNGGTLAIGSGTGIGHTASQTERAAFIRAYAAHIGIDPNTALRVAQSEGFYQFSGDHGTSFGDFQMHVGGGLGDRLRRMGINPADPHSWMQSDKVALDIARREGWSAWHGAARVGISNRQGIGVHVAGPPPRPQIHEHHIQLNVDGAKLEKVISRRQMERGMFPTGIGAMNARNSYASPGTPFNDAA